MRVKILHFRPSCLLLPLLVCFFSLHLPTTLSANQGETLILIWDANQEQDLRGYRIYESDNMGNIGALERELLLEEIPPAHTEAGIAAITVSGVPEGYHCWAVTAFDHGQNESYPSDAECIPIGVQPDPIHMADFFEDGYYGSYPGVEAHYDSSMIYTFYGRPDEQLLTYRLWDINSPTEVEILVNGQSLGHADMTEQYECSLLRSIRIPPDFLNPIGLNTLTFRWNRAGPDDMWAVGTVGIVDLIPLPSQSFHGNLANVPGGDQSHTRMVGYTFQGSPGYSFLIYRVYDIDFEGEIEIFLNGRWLDVVDTVGNDTYLNPLPLFLPEHLILGQGVNTILFNNTFNPPYSLVWGVGDVNHP